MASFEQIVKFENEQRGGANPPGEPGGGARRPAEPLLCDPMVSRLAGDGSPHHSGEPLGRARRLAEPQLGEV